MSTKTTQAIAIVCSDGKGHGAVIHHVGLGPAVDESGLWSLSALGLEDAPEGVRLWKGLLELTSFEFDEDDFDFVLSGGEWRLLLLSEMESLCRGGDPLKEHRCSKKRCDQLVVKDGLCKKHSKAPRRK